jgi:hypothetical protein
VGRILRRGHAVGLWGDAVGWRPLRWLWGRWRWRLLSHHHRPTEAALRGLLWVGSRPWRIGRKWGIPVARRLIHALHGSRWPWRRGAKKRPIEGENRACRTYKPDEVVFPVDPIVLASLCGLLGSLAVMAGLALAQKQARRRRPRRRPVPAPDPTVKMDALALEALEETMPVADWLASQRKKPRLLLDLTPLPEPEALSPEPPSRAQRVQEMPAVSSSRASHLVGELPPPPPPTLDDLGFEGSDDAATRIDERSFPMLPPPPPVPADLAGPPPVPPLAPGQVPEPLPIYRRSRRLARASGVVPTADRSSDEHVESAVSSSTTRPRSDPPPDAQPLAFTYGDRSRRA